MIYYFDSYGVKPDGELSRISSGVRYMLHENQKALTRLIRTIPKSMNFEYNKTRFQKYSPNINTCGKWTTIFSKCVLQGMTLKEFTSKIRSLSKSENLSYDEVVCLLWDDDKLT
eukprot:scaffold2854_cov215-Ochromonas_danica.AAC.1